jgi:hypothetical protein
MIMLIFFYYLSREFIQKKLHPKSLVNCKQILRMFKKSGKIILSKNKKQLTKKSIIFKERDKNKKINKN